jgi:hypothetical protein
MASAADNTDDNRRTGGSMRPLLLAAVALLAVGIANIDVKPTETKTVKVPVERVVTKTVVKRVEVARAFDGYISRKECQTLVPGTKFRALVNRFGWPSDSDDYYPDMYDGSYMNYTLREDHDSFCSIDIDYDEVSGVEVL